MSPPSGGALAWTRGFASRLVLRPVLAVGSLQHLSFNNFMRDLGDFIRYLADRDFSPASVVDVGACYGTPELFRNLPEARHVFIEPLPEMAARLEMLSRKYRGEYHQVALSDHEGSVRIGYNSAPDAASMAYSDVNHEHSHEVRVTTLDHLFHGSSWD